MKSSRGYIGLGILLVVLGLLFLLQNFDLFNINVLGDLIWGVLFGAAGLVFLWVFASNLEGNWWAVIPGFTLLGLAGLVAFGDFLGEAGAALFLGAIGLSFLGHLRGPARVLVGHHSGRNPGQPGGHDRCDDLHEG